jgi:hypothetical protein
MNISCPRTLLHDTTQAFTRKIRSIISSLPKAILFVQFLPFFHSPMNVWSIQAVYRHYKMSNYELQTTVAIRKLTKRQNWIKTSLQIMWRLIVPHSFAFGDLFHRSASAVYISHGAEQLSDVTWCSRRTDCRSLANITLQVTVERPLYTQTAIIRSSRCMPYHNVRARNSFMFPVIIISELQA